VRLVGFIAKRTVCFAWLLEQRLYPSISVNSECVYYAVRTD